MGRVRDALGHFNLIRMTLDHFGTTLGPLFVYESSFSKHLSYDFMKHWGRIEVTWGYVGVTLESVCGRFEITLVPFWV